MQEDKVRAEMAEVYNLVLNDVATIRTGRASPSIVQDIVIPAYGGTQKLKVMELANISAVDAQTIIIEPWDKSIIGEIRKGIMAANIGVSPVIDGEVIRISFPLMTSEDRQKYVKLLGSKLENGKVMIRRIRSDAMREIKKLFESKELSEDEKFAAEKRLQDVTDEFIAKIDDAGNKKKEELLSL